MEGFLQAQTSTSAQPMGLGNSAAPPSPEGISSILPRVIQRANDLSCLTYKLRSIFGLQSPKESNAGSSAESLTPYTALVAIERNLNNSLTDLEIIGNHLNS